jgi:hypothetical protein
MVFSFLYLAVRALLGALVRSRRSQASSSSGIIDLDGDERFGQ